MKNVLLFVLAMFLGCPFMIAQEAPALPKQVKVGKPAILKPATGTYKKEDLEREFCPGSKWGTKNTVQEFWNVRSDRNNNTLYADPTKSRQLTKKLYFKEQVVIAEVRGDMALVYADAKLEHYPTIPSYAKSLGWIPMENLLLWDKCPTDKRGVQYKALIAINLSKMGGGRQFKGKYYEVPEGEEFSHALPMDMKFYFIMKEAGKGNDMRVLLCSNPTVQGNNLLGWVDNNAYSAWEQRACLEPNWNPKYAVDNEKKEVGVYASEHLTSGDKVTSWEYGKKNQIDNDPYSCYRMVPQQLRFPILDKVDENANHIHCTSYSNRLGQANFAPTDRKAIQKVETIRQMRGQANIVFVVEATTEMQAVLPAIKECIKKWGADVAQRKIKMGAVLYRTATQGATGIETVALTNYDDPQLNSMFSASKANGQLTTTERDVALSLAIEKASDPSLMGFKKDQNNLIIVVGSRGAPESDTRLSSSQLLSRLSDNYIQVMSVQVTRNQTGSWVKFNDQMVELIKTNVHRQYVDQKDDANFSLRQGGDGYNFKSKAWDKSTLFAQIRYPKEFGKSLTAQEITNYVNNGINGFTNVAVDFDEHWEEALSDIEFDPAFLKKYLGESGYENWKKIKAISAYDGYTYRKDPEGNDYWHYILYLSGDELRKLLDDLKPAYIAAKAQSDDRKPYVDAMRALIKAHYGQQDDKKFDTMDADELQKLIYGLDVHTEMTNHRNLKDLQDPRVVTTIEFRKILKKFSDNYEKIQKYFNDGYTYRTQFGVDYYYWIPIEDLP